MIKKTDGVQFIQGLLMGSANIIPGASGGTIALILGIYQRLITAVSHFDREWIRALKRRDWKTVTEHVDLRFLNTLGLGVVVGTVSLGSLMHTLLEDHEEVEIQKSKKLALIETVKDRFDTEQNLQDLAILYEITGF